MATTAADQPLSQFDTERDAELEAGVLSAAAEERAVPQLPALRTEYQRLWAGCRIRSERSDLVDALVDRLAAARARYASLERALGVPWYFTGAVHLMESNARFDRHLHNGDPLTARTRQVPAGRPPTGAPPFTWEHSALDALRLKRLDRWEDWSVAGVLFKLEEYNGWGYRQYHPEVLSPYLWSFSKHYERGKYVADGRFDPRAVSGQCGAAVLLKRMVDRGLIPAWGDGEPPKPAKPALRWSGNRVLKYGDDLQQFLNTLPGIELGVDGKLGERSSDAFAHATGRRLLGDPRDAPRRATDGEHARVADSNGAGEAATEEALAEVDCSAATTHQTGPAEGEELLGEMSLDELLLLEELAGTDAFEEEGDAERVARRPRIMVPGGGWAGSESPVRRCIAIGRANGLVVTSLKRSWGSTGSDHNTVQRRSFAADLSNGSRPTPQMDRTARQIAAAIGRRGWRGGLLNHVENGLRLQLIWRYEGHYDHVHVGVRRL